MTHKLLAVQPGLRNPLLPDSIGGNVSASPTLAVGNWVIGLINMFIVITALASLIYLVIGGLEWVTSEGEKGKLESARNKITQAIIGLVIVASAYAVWTIILKFLGLNATNLPFPTMGNG